MTLRVKQENVYETLTEIIKNCRTKVLPVPLWISFPLSNTSESGDSLYKLLTYENSIKLYYNYDRIGFTSAY